jgi:5'-deoxynucleotidase YfbR-like HD superfamily hydrolase
MSEPYILTTSGRAFYFQISGPEDIQIEDIAHHLAGINRFTGAARQQLSVAQHSVWCSEYVEQRLTAKQSQVKIRAAALHALLHDAAEAYLGDISSPLKSLLPDYRAIELRVEGIVREKFGIMGEWDEVVKEADLRALATEKRDLMPDSPIWSLDVEPFGPPLEHWGFFAARERFLSRYWELLARGVG